MVGRLQRACNPAAGAVFLGERPQPSMLDQSGEDSLSPLLQDHRGGSGLPAAPLLLCTLQARRLEQLAERGVSHPRRTRPRRSGRRSRLQLVAQIVLVMKPPPDNVLRAITDDGAFRVITALTTQTTSRAATLQKCGGATAKTFSDLITGAILFRETMAPDLRVQGILKGAGGKGSLVADSHPSGSTRGLVQMAPGTTEIRLGGDAMLQMMRTLPNGRINQGVVQVPELGGISEALMAYMQSSEQVDTMLAVSTVLDEAGNIRASGGYMVQLLPEVGRGPLMVMTERLADFRSVEKQLQDEAFSTATLMGELLYGMAYTTLDRDDVSFGCWCSELRLISALATLSRTEIEDLVKDGQVLEISCDYCGKQYQIPPAKLQGLLDQS